LSVIPTEKVIEYETRTFDSAAFVRDGRVDFNPQAQSIGKVSLRWEKEHLQLQAGGMIGLIPLNATTVLEVRTRVPVGRLEEIIRRSDTAPFVPLNYDRGFTAAELDALTIDDLMAARFSAILDELTFEGLYKTYARKAFRGSSPAGRILPVPTYLSLRTSLRPHAHFETFARSIDNHVNRLILAAAQALRATLASQAGHGARRLARTLRAQMEMFEGVGPLAFQGIWQGEPLPFNRPVLQQAVELARLILMRRGVRFFGEGHVRLPSFLINMEAVFENYVRRVFENSSALAHFAVLDGNRQPPLGAASEIFEVPGPLGNHDTKPDIVFRIQESVVCVADVKYKPCRKQPDRSSLEQVLVYALAYGASHAVLIFPCASGQSTSIEFLGTVKGISCHKATLQLMDPDLDVEEALLCDGFAHLLE
jgi:5-methylcytosine-specific restriction enzyme subunit McrC